MCISEEKMQISVRELLMIGPAYTQVVLKTSARWPTFFLGFLFVGFVFFMLFDQQVHDPV